MKRSCLAMISVATLTLSASAQPCYNLELVPGTTTNSGTVTCQVEDSGWTLGIPTPWGTFGWNGGAVTYTTACTQTITIVPPTYDRVPGDSLVGSSSVTGEVKTYSGCSFGASGAVCEYSSTPQDYLSWKVLGPCEGLPPEPRR